MQLQPIVYVSDMDRSLEWYGRLLGRSPSVVSEHWSTFEVGTATLALHLDAEPGGPGGVELSLVVDEPLEDAADRIGPADPIRVQPFGRSFLVADPDGRRIQVNEHGHD